MRKKPSRYTQTRGRGGPVSPSNPAAGLIQGLWGAAGKYLCLTGDTKLNNQRSPGRLFHCSTLWVMALRQFLLTSYFVLYGRKCVCVSNVHFNKQSTWPYILDVSFKFLWHIFKNSTYDSHNSSCEEHFQVSNSDFHVAFWWSCSWVCNSHVFLWLHVRMRCTGHQASWDQSWCAVNWWVGGQSETFFVPSLRACHSGCAWESAACLGPLANHSQLR